jgi:2-oxoisovalerate dehydrogenase E2 component (dihydrolipoyl transacylase)
VILVEVMTDKASVEIPSPVAGTVLALGGEVGQTLAVGSELIRIELADGAVSSAPAAAAASRSYGSERGGDALAHRRRRSRTRPVRPDHRLAMARASRTLPKRTAG